MKYVCNSKLRRYYLNSLNQFFKSNFSIDEVFTKDFNDKVKTYPYYDYQQISSTVNAYLGIVLTKEILDGILWTFDDDLIDYNFVSLQRTVAIGKSHFWIVNDFIDDRGFFNQNILFERLVKLNNFVVPTKNT